MSAAHDPGIDEASLTRWFNANIEGVRGMVSFERTAGGRSNLTYLARDEHGSQWILRRAPLGMGSSRTHDVLREAGVLNRLRNSAVPVPLVHGTCDDLTVTGAPFFIMEFVDGVILRDPGDVEAAIPLERRHSFASSAIGALAELHEVDPSEVGWASLARRTDYLPRQLARWSANWKADRVRVLDDIGRTHDRLLERLPQPAAPGIVHGDFRIDNCVFTPDGRLLALLDWELATVGDPLADLGQLLAYWAEPGDPVRTLENPPTLAAGVPGRDDLIKQYLTERPVADPHDLGFYIAYSWWKIACIVENVYARTRRGAMGGSDRTPDSFARQAERIAAEAWRLARQL